MEVKQVYDFTNNAVKQAIGEESVLLKEDLSNVVEVGNAILNANALDKYVDALVNHIGRMVFVTRPYTGVYAKLQMDAWEFGSVLEKVRMQMPQAEENETWNLTDGAIYEENQFYKPIISAKFFNKMVTFEIPISITEKQVRQSFSNQTQLNSFISMIMVAVENAMTLRVEELARRAINNMIGETIHADYGNDALNSKSGVKAVNLLYLYNQTITTPITKAEALFNEGFLRFAFYTMALYRDRIKTMSTLFNIEGKENHTPSDRLHFVILTELAKASQVYLQSDVYHDELVKLEGFESVPYWQGIGDKYALSETSAINISLASDKTIDISTDGILGVMFDRDAIAITNYNRRVTSKWNAKAEFTNYWFKMDNQYLNSLDENCIVFFIQ